MLSNCKGNVVNRMNLEQYKGVFIYAQQVDNKIDAIALELLGKANDLAADLGTDVTAVLIGSDVKGLVDELAEYGADKVIVVDDPELKEYRTAPYTPSMLTAFFVLFFLPVFLNFSVIIFFTSSPVSLYCKSALTEDDLMVRFLFFSSIPTPWDANRC